MAHIGPDTLFNSAIVEKRWKYGPDQTCRDEPASKKIEEGAFGLTHAYHFQEEWLRAARVGDRLTQLLQGTLCGGFFNQVTD